MMHVWIYSEQVKKANEVPYLHTMRHLRNKTFIVLQRLLQRLTVAKISTASMYVRSYT